MTPNECRDITQQRLRLWGAGCVQDHHTPMLLLTIGHDQVSGRIGLHTLNEPQVTNEVLVGFLRYALAELGAPDHQEAVDRLVVITALRDMLKMGVNPEVIIRRAEESLRR